MTIPPGPLTIMGIPYTVDVCERTDRDDPDYSFTIDREAGFIRVRDSMAEDGQRACVMGAVFLEARQLLEPDHPIDEKQDTSMAAALLGSLRTNPELVAYLIGDREELPTELNLLGALWTVSWVDVVPGMPIRCAGLCQYGPQRIWLRVGYPPAYRRQHLLHEWCHAVADLAALTLRDDEAYIRVVSATLFEVMVHNPAFMRELLQA